MTDLRYLLAILTCGRPAYLQRTLASYAAFLDPQPTAVYAWDDGLQTPREAFSAFHPYPHVEGEPQRIGRCAGHARLWHATHAYPGIDWVFTVEDDIVLLRPLNLRHLAETIEAEPTLAQLALVRCPWGAEIEHGGYIAQFPDRYDRRTTNVWAGSHGGWREAHWIASTVDWTSSPALLPMSLPRTVAWPSESGCELELGPRILAQRPDAVSGYFGWGEPWCAHVGMARVEGSHGY